MPIETIDPKLCNGCAICIDSCPMDVIRFDTATKLAYAKYPRDCVACYNCELDCPTKAIYVSPQRGRTIVGWIGRP